MVNFIRDMWAPCLFTGALLVVSALLAGALARDARQWSEFKTTHNCQRVAESAVEVVPVFGYSSDGRMTTGFAVDGGETGWLCDDGVTYWR